MTSLSLGEIAAHMADQPVDAKRIKGLAASFITGQVAAAGTVTAGTGFTVNRSATGVFDITFTTPFAAAPTVLTSAGNTSGARFTARVTAVAAGTCTVTVGSASTGADSNEPFNFVAFPTT